MFREKYHTHTNSAYFAREGGEARLRISVGPLRQVVLEIVGVFHAGLG